MTGDTQTHIDELQVDNRWRVRKEISLPTLAFLVLQALALAWGISAAWASLNEYDRAADNRLERLEKIDAENRLTRLEADSETTKRLLERIDAKLDRLIEKQKGG